MCCPVCKKTGRPTYPGRRKCKDCYRLQKKQRRQDNWARLAEYKTNKPCSDCGQCYPSYVMEFDHRPGESKIAAVSDLVGLEWSWEKILTEIEKCDLCCANCHRIRTYILRKPPA